MQSIWIKQDHNGLQPEQAAGFQTFQTFKPFQALKSTEAVVWYLTEILDPLFVSPFAKGEI